MTTTKIAIGKVTVTYDGEKFSYELPMGMTAKGLAQWKRRNSEKLNAIAESYAKREIIIDDVRIVKPSGTPNLTYYLPMGMTGDTFTKFKEENADAISVFNWGVNGI